MVKGLTVNNIYDIPCFHQEFINIWEAKENPPQILSEYETIKIFPKESVQDYCTRFNKLYNALPANMRPPQGIVLLKFPYGFDLDLSYHLKERDSSTLEEMKKYFVIVEANLLA